MNTVKIGVIGIGNMGSAHAKSIFNNKINNLKLTAVCDTNTDRLAWAKENFNTDISMYADCSAMLDNEKLDAVIIATPHYSHPSLAIQTLQKGVNVLIEKPAGVYTKQVEEMNKAAEKAGKIFSIMYNQRTNPLYGKVKELVESGELGNLKRFIWIITNWYRTQAYYDSGSWRASWAGEGGGVLLNQCPHNLDLWQWITGMPCRVRGFCSYGKYHNIEVEDEVTAYAEHENGLTSVFITTTGEYPGTNRMEISGDRGKVVLEGGKLHFWKLEESERDICFNSKEGFATPPVTSSEIIPDNEETGHNGIIQNFTNAILHGEKLIAPGTDGIRGLEISNAIYLSDWTNNWVELPVDKELYFHLLKKKINESKIKPVINNNQSVDGSFKKRWDIHW